MTVARGSGDGIGARTGFTGKAGAAGSRLLQVVIYAVDETRRRGQNTAYLYLHTEIRTVF